MLEAEERSVEMWICVDEPSSYLTRKVPRSLNTGT